VTLEVSPLWRRYHQGHAWALQECATLERVGIDDFGGSAGRKGRWSYSLNSTVLRERLLKQAVRELGHTLPLAHCEDYQCVMSPSHRIEWIDLKTSQILASGREESLGWGVASG